MQLLDGVEKTFVISNLLDAELDIPNQNYCIPKREYMRDTTSDIAAYSL